jgi:DNA-binding transcriptional LysR family regulator
MRQGPKSPLGSRLNLVAALDALLQERSVSAAAARCGITQSGMSHALAELRRLLGDALLVRIGNTMQLTPRAAHLAPGLRRGLDEIELALAGEAPFDPARSERVLRLGASDAATVAVVPRLLARVRPAAPRLRFEVLPLTRIDGPGALETGELDLLITAPLPERSGLRRAVLYHDGFVCVLRRDHPALRRRFDLEAYLSLEHVVVTTGDRGASVIDHHLERLGRARTIALRVGYFLAAPVIVAGSDLVVSMPALAAAALVRGHPLACRPVPLPMRRGPISMVWHERYADDPVSQWLRGELAAVGAELEVSSERAPARRRRARSSAGAGR